MSRFVTRLADHQDVVVQVLVAATNDIRELIPKVMDGEDTAGNKAPPLGQFVAVDSTLFESFSNPNRLPVSDPDATWGLKHSARAKENGEEFGFGYKMHLVSDCFYGVPLDFIVTPANEGDSPILRSLMDKARETHPWLKPAFLMADRGYDSKKNHQHLAKDGTIPIIHMRRPANSELHDGIYDEKGRPHLYG